MEFETALMELEDFINLYQWLVKCQQKYNVFIKGRLNNRDDLTEWARIVFGADSLWVSVRQNGWKPLSVNEEEWEPGLHHIDQFTGTVKIVELSDIDETVLKGIYFNAKHD
jgi:hypothetical protein